MDDSTEPARLSIESNDDVVRARQLVRNIALECRLTLVEQTKLVTAASELARNTLIHGGGGSIRISLVSRGARQGVRAVFEDRGPGIADVDQALTDGWSSGSGLGLGLSGSRRLVDEFEIETEPGRGTKVTVTKWAR
ncbi:MAG TPA: anti-sigma regulatory factor [Actinospica sp.]|jgi:serine/threonine-protein kinase RsbT|nr:anti-sigma regulatory factor [Actinospica sp.]